MIHKAILYYNNYTIILHNILYYTIILYTIIYISALLSAILYIIIACMQSVVERIKVHHVSLYVHLCGCLQDVTENSITNTAVYVGASVHVCIYGYIL